MNREPMWYCHECHAEMRPLMTPDPICASCRGSFVEKIENPSDDPRQFAHAVNANDLDGVPPGVDLFLHALQGLMQPRATPSSGFGVSLTSSGLGGNRTRRFDVPPSSDRPPTMSEFARRGSDGSPEDGIAGSLMAQYLMALLSAPGRNNGVPGIFSHLADPLQSGRMGDYVFNQEALDEIITQLMEHSNSSRPVPATEELIRDLPREVLLEGSPTLEKDCAVCKEQFQLGTEDPAEQVVVTLPCKHPFHEPCIVPWLKSSGTCPVCRHALVPQPDQPGTPSPSGSGTQPNPAPAPSPFGRAGNILSSLFSGGSNTDEAHPSSPPGRRRSSQRRRSSDNSGSPNLPGSWDHD